jgi:hypothetical protein
MPKTRGRGLMMAWTDVDPEFEVEFNAWYDDEHMHRLRKVPGFLTGARYCALRGGPKYLAMYELEDHKVLSSAAFQDALRREPSSDRAHLAPSVLGRNFLQNGYRQIHPVKSSPIEDTMEPARFLQIGRIDIAAAMEEEFNDWYNTAYIPGFLRVPGCLRARRFIAVDGLPKYLTVYEFANAGVPDSMEWTTARVANPWSQRMRPHVRLDEGSPAVFERIFPA